MDLDFDDDLIKREEKEITRRLWSMKPPIVLPRHLIIEQLRLNACHPNRITLVVEYFKSQIGKKSVGRSKIAPTSTVTNVKNLFTNIVSNTSQSIVTLFSSSKPSCTTSVSNPTSSCSIPINNPKPSCRPSIDNPKPSSSTSIDNSNPSSNTFIDNPMSSGRTSIDNPMPLWLNIIDNPMPSWLNFTDNQIPSCCTSITNQMSSCSISSDNQKPSCSTNIENPMPSSSTFVNNQMPSWRTFISNQMPYYSTPINNSQPSCSTSVDNQRPSCSTSVDNERPSCSTFVDNQRPSCSTFVDNERPSCSTSTDYQKPSCSTAIEIPVTSCSNYINNLVYSNSSLMDNARPSGRRTRIPYCYGQSVVNNNNKRPLCTSPVTVPWPTASSEACSAFSRVKQNKDRETKSRYEENVYDAELVLNVLPDARFQDIMTKLEMHERNPNRINIVINELIEESFMPTLSIFDNDAPSTSGQRCSTPERKTKSSELEDTKDTNDEFESVLSDNISCVPDYNTDTEVEDLLLDIQVCGKLQKLQRILPSARMKFLEELLLQYGRHQDELNTKVDEKLSKVEEKMDCEESE